MSTCGAKIPGFGLVKPGHPTRRRMPGAARCLKVLTESAGLLEAFELLQSVGHQWRAIRFTNEVEKCIRCNGSPTGIRDGRSYDPWEPLRAVQCTRLLDGKSFALQEVYLLHFSNHRCAVQVRSV